MQKFGLIHFVCPSYGTFTCAKCKKIIILHCWKRRKLCGLSMILRDAQKKWQMPLNQLLDMSIFLIVLTNIDGLELFLCFCTAGQLIAIKCWKPQNNAWTEWWGSLWQWSNMKIIIENKNKTKLTFLFHCCFCFE